MYASFAMARTSDGDKCSAAFTARTGELTTHAIDNADTHNSGEACKHLSKSNCFEVRITLSFLFKEILRFFQS